MTTATKRFAVVFLCIGLLTAAWIAYNLYDLYVVPQVKRTAVVRFPSEGTLEEALDTLAARDLIRDTALVREALEREDMTYRSGQFELMEGMSAYELARYLKVGRQKESRVILTNGRLPGDAARQAVRYVEADSASVYDALMDSLWLDSVGLTRETALTAVIPNTYNVYWDASGVELRDRLYKECQRFWDRDNRRAKADSLGLTPAEVYTLASIVESETNDAAERPTIAGAYLNRLERGIKLDADPTVVFAVGDFGLRRVLYKHLSTDSPYNTYLYAGLPPGPIAMASVSSIDAVLNAEDHDYIFFVAKGDGSGTHAFASDMRGHSRNIRAYKQQLRARGIR